MPPLRRTQPRLARKTLKPEKSAAQLLKRLLQERRADWEEAELKRLRAAGKPPKDNKWKKRYSEPASPRNDDLIDLPKEWKWASLEMIATLGSGISVSQNRMVKKPVEVPYLRVANVLRGKLDLSEIKTIRVSRDQLGSFSLKRLRPSFQRREFDKLRRGWTARKVNFLSAFTKTMYSEHDS